MSQPGSLAFALLFVLAVCPARADDDVKSRRDARLDEMRRLAAKLEPQSVETKQAQAIKLRGEPLMRFDDPTRDFYDGTLWAWGESGRPRLLVSIERYEKVWAYEFIATGDHVALKVPSGQTWQPEPPALAMSRVDDLRPSATAAARRQQARELSRRFEMAEFLPPDDARTTLRLFPRPIHEYGNEKADVLTGAMFVYANGTNPEVLLIVEAVRSDSGEVIWQHGCAPLSTARLEATLAGRVVWEAEKMRLPQFDRPYVAVALPFSEE